MFPKITFSIERWKYNPTFELYVSNKGHIKNKSKADIAPKVTLGGYMVVYVYGSLNRYMLLHRVVMLTWKPTPEAENLTVDHLDHNKRNNALSNLEWVSREENLRRAANDYVHDACLEEVVNYGNEKKKEKKEEVHKSIKGFRVEKKASSKVTGKEKVNGFYFKNTEFDIAEAVNYLKGYDQNFSLKALKAKIKTVNRGANISGGFSYCGFTFKVVYEGEESDS